jgi:hypothetical protein
VTRDDLAVYPAVARLRQGRAEDHHRTGSHWRKLTESTRMLGITPSKERTFPPETESQTVFLAPR